MSETVQVELSKNDQDVLLRGLRFIRRSVMLEMEDRTPAMDAKRAKELERIDSITEMITGKASTAVV